MIRAVFGRIMKCPPSCGLAAGIFIRDARRQGRIATGLFCDFPGEYATIRQRTKSAAQRSKGMVFDGLRPAFEAGCHNRPGFAREQLFERPGNG